MLTEDSLNGNEKLPQCRISRISLLFCETGTLTYFFILPLAAPLFHELDVVTQSYVSLSSAEPCHAMLPSKQHRRRVLTDGGACSRHTAPPFRNACATDGIPAQDLEDAPARTLSVPESTLKSPSTCRDMRQNVISRLSVFVCMSPG